jgi:enoyl-CoA hydratase/carnithine racemase
MEFCSAFIGPNDAKTAGLVDAVCDEKAVEENALVKIREMAALPPTAFALTKQHRTREIPSQFQAIRQDLNRAFMDCWFAPATQDLLKEAAQKF